MTATAQTASKAWPAPRTPDGRPDLQGVWDFATLAPLERPRSLGRGHLVVETTNFTDKTSFRGTSENLRLIERFTRVGPDRLNYECTIDDPASYAKSWTVMVPTRRNAEPIYEYACQEGNYGLEGQPSSSRAEDQVKDAATAKALASSPCLCFDHPVPIKASSARQIETLLADLGSDRVATREAAVARLTLIGARAVDRLLLLLDSGASADARAAALRALEAIADLRALDGVLGAIDAADSTVGCAAAAAARVFLRGPRGNVAVDRLTTAVMDTSRNEEVRIAALGALSDLERSTLAPLLAALQGDPSDAVKAATRLSATVDHAEVVTRAADRGLPQDPEELGEAVARAGGGIALPLLLRVIERVREREASAPAARRAEWTRVRGRAHAVLAARGSRIALYDLRESLESMSAAAAPLPVEFLTALSTAGDASCLEAVAAAYARAPPSGPASRKGAGGPEDHDWWRDRLTDAFRTIVRRERLTRRHAVVKKIGKRWGSALERLWVGI